MAFEVKNKKWLGYIAYIILVTVILLYYLFPAQAVGEFVNKSVNRMDAEFAFKADKIGPSIPAGLRIVSGQVYQNSTPELTVLKVDSLYIGPQILKLLKGDYNFELTGEAYDGDFNGTVLAQDIDGKSIASTLSFKNFDVADYDLLSKVFSHKLIGRISGDISYNKGSSGSSKSGDGTADLRLRDGQLQFQAPIFSINSVDLQIIDLKLAIRNKEITVVKAEVEGSEVKGSITGSIHLQPEMKYSQLNLKGTLEPQAEFYKKYPEIRELLKSIKKRVKRGQYSFVITGTLGEPKFRLL